MNLRKRQRDPFGVRELAPENARIIRKSPLAARLRDAQAMFQQAPSPRVFVEDKRPSSTAPRDGAAPEGAGDDLVTPGHYEPAPLSDDDRKRALEQIAHARRAIEDALKKIEEEIEKPDRLDTILLVIAVALVAVGIGLIVWGVVAGSEIALVGKEGVGSFCVVTGIGILVWLRKTGSQLRTFVNRVRARLAACESRPTYEGTHECFAEALGLLDDAIQGLPAVASS